MIKLLQRASAVPSCPGNACGWCSNPQSMRRGSRTLHHSSPSRNLTLARSQKVLTATLTHSTAEAADISASQSMLLEDLMSSLQSQKKNEATVQAPPVKASPPVAPVAPPEVIEVQEAVQSKIQEAANVAGSLFQANATANDSKDPKTVEKAAEGLKPSEKEQASEEVDIKQQMQEILVPKSENDTMSLILGVGGAAAVLLLAVVVQAVQRSKSDKNFTDKITGLTTQKTDLEAKVKNLDETREGLEKALEEEKVAKGQSQQRGTELDTRLAETIKSLDAATAEKELVKATLVDTKKDLEKEKEAGAKLGEQVITLSKQLEDETVRAVKAEDQGKQLQKDVEEKAKSIASEKEGAEKLRKQVSELQNTVKEMTDEAAKQAAAAHELGESAKEAKAKAEAAYSKVSMQLQSTVDQVKTLKASLAETTKALEKTDNTVKSRDSDLKKAKADGEALQKRLDQTLGDLKKAKEAIEQKQQDNSTLNMEKHSLQDRVNKLSKTLEDTTLRLSTEVDVASEMKSQLAELKLEYIAAGDKLEAEQSVIRELQVDLRNMESALNAVSHDKKAAQMENVQLSSQLEAAQKAVLAAENAQAHAEHELNSSQTAMHELQGRVEDATAALEASSTAAQSTSEELESERAERAALQAQVEALKQHVASIEQAERTAHEQAQSAVQELRQEIQAVKARKKTSSKSSGTSQKHVSVAAERVPALAATAGKAGVGIGTKKSTKRSEKKS